MPAKVTGLTLSPGDDHIRVAWNAAARATGYEVEWKSGTEAYTSTRREILGGAGITSTTIDGLSDGTAYTVRGCR